MNVLKNIMIRQLVIFSLEHVEKKKPRTSSRLRGRFGQQG